VKLEAIFFADVGGLIYKKYFSLILTRGEKEGGDRLANGRGRGWLRLAHQVEKTID